MKAHMKKDVEVLSKLFAGEVCIPIERHDGVVENVPLKPYLAGDMKNLGGLLGAGSGRRYSIVTNDTTDNRKYAFDTITTDGTQSFL
jgi:hypothetical protein